MALWVSFRAPSAVMVGGFSLSGCSIDELSLFDLGPDLFRVSVQFAFSWSESSSCIDLVIDSGRRFRTPCQTARLCDRVAIFTPSHVQHVQLQSPFQKPLE